MRTLLAGATMIGAMVQAASAADLPPIYETPVYETPVYQDVPEVVPVEIGSGWYLRGDVGYNFDGRLVDSKDTIVGDGFRTYSDVDEQDRFTGSLGFGYQFTDLFRGELSAEYLANLDLGSTTIRDCSVLRDVGADGASDFVPSTDSCRNRTDAGVDVYDLMANAYLDLGTFWSVTPYVGGGAGVAYVDSSYSSKTSCNENADAAIDCSPTVYGAQPGESATGIEGDFDHQDWRFAWSLMAGAAVDVTENLKVDVGYRYLNLSGDDLFGADDDSDIDIHQLRAGLRYALW